MITSIYNNLEVEIEFGTSKNPMDSDVESIVEMSVNSRRQGANIAFPQIGSDINQRLHEILHRVKREGIQVAELFLSVKNPYTPFVMEQLEKLGFLFTGILPGTTGGDLVIMQYLNGIVIDYSAIKLESELAMQLVEYIKKHDLLETY